ncbi:MAG TPA: GTPase [Gemmataceae bacterium]|nr:GTPase [Gemmataceae bacterium]
MSRWRIAVVLFLIAVPFSGLALVGTYYLWRDRLGFLSWWPLALCMLAGYLLALHWHRKQKLLYPVDFAGPLHWTDRDREAKMLVEARARRVSELNPAKLTDLKFYLETAEELAKELAQFYHPGAKDPYTSLTIPEVLAVVELASHDLAERVDRYLPGGHLLTIGDWMRARQLADWAPALTNAYWIGSALLDPVSAGIRFVATRLGLSTSHAKLQEYLLVWFYTAFVERVGTYLIEVNSGRLKIGARRYRELVLRPFEERAAGREPEGNGRPAPAPPTADPADAVRTVTLTLLGQVKAGKSSLINALLGEQRAKTDVLPATAHVSRYELQQPGNPTKLVLLDTVGYGHTGPKADQVRATQEAAEGSDLLLLVLHARNPGRQADLQMLQELRSWFVSHPDLKRPRVLAVVTHIDLLSPALEWAPPYDWQHPRRPKEEHIGQAVATVQEQLGEFLVGVVPVCTAAGKVYGIDEWLLPAMAELLDEAHAVALLRTLKAEFDKAKIRKVFRQLLDAGRQAVKVFWKGLPTPGPGGAAP